jgi:hypothetical protein
MRRWMFLIALCLLGACGDDASSSPPDAAAPDARVPDAAAAPDAAAPDAGPQSFCLDAPTDLPRPPTGRLPCDLVPPGL